MSHLTARFRLPQPHTSHSQSNHTTPTATRAPAHHDAVQQSDRGCGGVLAPPSCAPQFVMPCPR